MVVVVAAVVLVIGVANGAQPPCQVLGYPSALRQMFDAAIELSFNSRFDSPRFMPNKSMPEVLEEQLVFGV